MVALQCPSITTCVLRDHPHIFPPTSAMEVIESVPPVCVCLCGFLRATLCTTSWVQEYVVHHRPALCTPKLCCAPWCSRGTYVCQKWGSPPTFLIFFMVHKEHGKNGSRGRPDLFVISSNRDGALYDGVSLTVIQISCSILIP